MTATVAEVLAVDPRRAQRLAPSERQRMIAELERAELERIEADRHARVVAQVAAFADGRTVEQLLARIREPKFRQAAERWDWGMPGVVLSGPSRAGKTTAACALFLRLAGGSNRLWERLRWVGSLRYVKAAQDATAGPERDMLVSPVLYERASLLVLDDLGKEPETNWGRQVLHELLDTRYLRGLPTITTTELSKSQIAERYGAAFAARLVECRGKVGKVLEAGR